MEYGKWIAFAFLAGAVLVGFKSRQLKAYEFIVSGLFLLLLDQLVFHGQIGAWIGQLGDKAKGAAAHGAMTAPFLAAPTARAKARRFAAAIYKHRPSWSDYLPGLAVLIAAHYWWGIAWPAGLVIYAAVMVAVTVAAAISDTRHTPSTAGPATGRPRDGRPLDGQGGAAGQDSGVSADD